MRSKIDYTPKHVLELKTPLPLPGGGSCLRFEMPPREDGPRAIWMQHPTMPGWVIVAIHVGYVNSADEPCSEEVLGRREVIDEHIISPLMVERWSQMRMRVTLPDPLVRRATELVQ
jgi:hypothetical protein